MRASGKFGPGPLVNVLGIRTRLAPRSNQPDQRLTDQTYKAMGVVDQGDDFITLGFRGDRAQLVAARLEERNAFWGPNDQEIAAATDLAVQAVNAVIGDVRIEGSITIRVRL